MSFGTGKNTFGVELPRFTYAEGFNNPFKPSTSLSSSGMEVGVGTRGSYIKRLRDEGYTLEDAIAIADADRSESDDARLYGLIESAMDPKKQAELLRVKNEFEAERLAQAAPYNLMYQIPRTLTQAAVLPATVALGSAKTASDALASMGGVNLTGGALNPKAGGYFS